ncbi:MAG: hypothetical protein ABSG51_15220 [Terracidiphilus sp.]
MVSAELKREARQAWYEYGQAVIKAWRFREGSPIVAGELEELLAHSNDTTVRAFVEWVRQQTEIVQSMKFVGER